MASQSSVIGRRSFPCSKGESLLVLCYPIRISLTTWRPLITNPRLDEPSHATMRSTVRVTGRRVGLFSEHSQMTQHRQPASLRAMIEFSSISRLRLIFFLQNPFRLFGH